MPRNRRGWGMGSGGGYNQLHRTPLATALVEPALLVLLKERSRHGYTLLSDLDSIGLLNLHPSVIYRTLRDMEALDWIISDWDTAQTQGPPRRMYRLTLLGETILMQWRYELQENQRIISDLMTRMAHEKGSR